MENDRGAPHQEYRVSDGLRRIMVSGKGMGAEDGLAKTDLVVRRISVPLSQILRRAICICSIVTSCVTANETADFRNRLFCFQKIGTRHFVPNLCRAVLGGRTEITMKQATPIFEGAATALITPLNAEGIDYASFAKLIDMQINGGIDALVVCGTTGESSTLTDEEHRDAIKFAVQQTAGRVPVIAGTGSNDTAYAVDLTREACELGADAVLVVTPYYNKATQKGLVKMYNTIADASTKPVILYNVPSRTGVNIEPRTYVALAEHPNIAAVKEANGNLSKIVETAALVGDKLDIYSGNDDQIVPILSLGGKGVISVLSNLLPGETSELCHAYMRGGHEKSLAMQLKYLPLVNALFSEVNPIPVKAAMSAMGYCEEYYRLPLTPMEDATRAVLYDCMRKEGLIG